MAEELQISQESVLVSGNLEFTQKLEETIVDIRDTDITDQGAGRKLAKVIHDHVGLKMSVEFIDGNVKLMDVGFVGQLNTFDVTPKWLQKFLDETDYGEKGKKKYITGHIDLDKAKVTGDFTKLPFVLILGTDFFTHKSDYTVPEVTAFILHEIGHAFYQLATIGESIRTNYFLTEGVDNILNKKVNKYDTSIVELSKKVDDTQIAKMLKVDPTAEAIRLAVLNTSNYRMRDQFSTNSRSNAIRFEQISDMFASRMGYGKELASALDKDNSSSTKINTLTVLAITVTGYLTNSFFIGFGSLSVFITLGIVVGQLYTLYNTTNYHDTIEERYAKLSRDITAQLKKLPPNSNLAKKLRNDFKELSKIIDKAIPLKSKVQATMGVMDPTLRRRNHVTQLEQDLEVMMNNPVSVRLSELQSRI